MNEPPAKDDLATLLETSDAAFLPIVKSLLEAAGIPYVVQGEGAIDLFPLGPLGKTLAQHGLGAVVRVPSDRLEEARALLEETAREDEPERDE